MKWAYHVKYKMKAAAVLILIIIMILATNIWNRKTFSNLNESIASIYKDRLMPATYIFQLTDHLYRKRLLNNSVHRDAAISAELTRHNAAIEHIISTYETTYLTTTEKEQWETFKTSLKQYNTLSGADARDNKAIDEQFNKALQCLNNLSSIQASEGSNLLKSSNISVSGTVITSQFEIVLLIVLGVVSLVLITVSDNKLTQIQKQRLN